MIPFQELTGWWYRGSGMRQGWQLSVGYQPSSDGGEAWTYRSLGRPHDIVYVLIVLLKRTELPLPFPALGPRSARG